MDHLKRSVQQESSSAYVNMWISEYEKEYSILSFTNQSHMYISGCYIKLFCCWRQFTFSVLLLNIWTVLISCLGNFVYNNNLFVDNELLF